MTNDVSETVRTFKELYGEEPLVVRSPGRVNLIGEHTDYNLGYVLPAAIDRAIILAVTPRTDSQCVMTALDMKDRYIADLNDLQPAPRGWPNYLIGVLDQIQKCRYQIRGVNCVFGGDIPIGAGLSSSAAVEAGFAFALNEVFELGIDRMSLAKLAQRSESEFVGVKCGIMDQFINIFAKENAVLRIDCRSLEYTSVEIRGDAAILLFNTEVSHSLASSAYNKRREECGRGIAALSRRHPHIASLRDVPLELLESARSEMDATVFNRCAYVIRENARLLRGCEDLQTGRLSAFGEKMFETHEGLKNEYEVSCRELDQLVDIVRGLPGVYGARMMGGGFGGCTINLVRPDAVGSVRRTVEERFRKTYGRTPPVYHTTIVGGTSVISRPRAASVTSMPEGSA